MMNCKAVKSWNLYFHVASVEDSKFIPMEECALSNRVDLHPNAVGLPG